MKENIREEVEKDIKPEELEYPEIRVTWKDNGQIMMTIACYPGEVNEIKKLFNFIQSTDFDITL